MSEKMRCLSLWQPWASMIFEKDEFGLQVKKDETRHWSTNVRGLIYIHAAKTIVGMAGFEDEELPEHLRGDRMPYGCIIGSVQLVECHRTEYIIHKRSQTQLSWGDYSPGRFAFQLEHPLKFREPIPYRGAQGFFFAELP